MDTNGRQWTYMDTNGPTTVHVHGPRTMECNGHRNGVVTARGFPSIALHDGSIGVHRPLLPPSLPPSLHLIAVRQNPCQSLAL